MIELIFLIFLHFFVPFSPTYADSSRDNLPNEHLGDTLQVALGRGSDTTKNLPGVDSEHNIHPGKSDKSWGIAISWEDVLVGVVVLFVGFVADQFRRWVLRLWRRKQTKDIYDAYMQELVTQSKNAERYQKRKVLAIEETPNQENVPIDIQELLKGGTGIHVVSKPGSGKTSLLKNLVWIYSGAYLARASKFVPVYLEFKQGDLFDRIINTLRTKIPARHLKLINRDWLDAELQKGRFLILIDDVHKGISNHAEKESSGIDELLEFKQNTFVLVGRDYVTRAEYGLPVYRLAELSREEVKEILKSECSEAEADQILGQMWWHSRTMDLYDTPQMMIFSARVFKKLGRLPINKTIAFREYMKMKFEEERKKVPRFNENLVQRILGGLALEMMRSQANPYVFDELNALATLQKVYQSLRNQYGFQDNSADLLLEQMLWSGFIIRVEDGYKFEHDQWQEFFAALQIFENNPPLKGIPSPYPLKEVAIFLLGFFSPDSNEEEKKRYRKLLEELVEVDFFLLSQCIKDSRREFEEKLLSQREEQTKSDMDAEQIRQAYGRFLEIYCTLIEREFSTLRNKFPPETNGPIGILVTARGSEPGYSYGFRKLSSEAEDKILFMGGTQGVARPGSFWEFFEQYGIDSLRWKGYDPALYDIPLLGAHQDITDALEHIIREKRLCESGEIQRERVFFETTAMKRHFGISPSTKSLTVKEILEGLKKRRIALFITPKFVENRSIDNARLNLEVERLFAEGFDPPADNSSTTLGGSYERLVNDRDCEATIRYLLDSGILTVDDCLEPLLKILPRELRFKKTPEMSNEQTEVLKQWTIQYYEKIYLNYKEMMESNFPRAKSSFGTYSRFPIHLVLVEQTGQRKTDRFGTRHEFGRVLEQKEPLKISVVQEAEFEKMRLYSSRNLSHIGSFWMVPHSAWEAEPVRKEVYKIIADNYRDLVN